MASTARPCLQYGKDSYSCTSANQCRMRGMHRHALIWTIAEPEVPAGDNAARAATSRTAAKYLKTDIIVFWNPFWKATKTPRFWSRLFLPICSETKWRKGYVWLLTCSRFLECKVGRSWCVLNRRMTVFHLSQFQLIMLYTCDGGYWHLLQVRLSLYVF